jgi:hypothetical protein
MATLVEEEDLEEAPLEEEEGDKVIKVEETKIKILIILMILL